MSKMEFWWNESDRRKPKYSQKTGLSVTLLPKISNRLTWHQTQASVLTDLHLTATVKAGPFKKEIILDYT
jgi:hypothetical protein